MRSIDPRRGRGPGPRRRGPTGPPGASSPRSPGPAGRPGAALALAVALAAPLAAPAILAAQAPAGPGDAAGEPADTVEGSVRLDPVSVDTLLRFTPVRLPPLTVEADRTGEPGKMRGFERRRRLHPAGVFLDRGAIERRDPSRLSDLMRGLAGVTPARPRGGVGQPRVRMDRTLRLPGRRPCRIRYFVDGLPVPKDGGFRIDVLAPEEVEGIEIYRGVSEVPIRFQRREDRCGVIVIWTRAPGRGRR